MGSPGDNKIQHLSGTATLIPLRNIRQYHTESFLNTLRRQTVEMVWAKEDELESDLNYSYKVDFRCA